MKRLDLFLAEKGFFGSRNKANEFIKKSNVKVDGKIVTKPSFLVNDDSIVEIFEEKSYVSRAGYKLKEFLKNHSVDIKKKVCLDIGSSTGGFCEVLLEYGAKEIYAVDVGKNQLHPKIKNSKKVNSFEECDIRKFDIDRKFDIVTCDVSFVGIKHILPAIKKFSNDKIILLFKPQFEVGKDVKRDKKGVVKDKKAIERVMMSFESLVFKLGWTLVKKEESSLRGKDGNVEIFYHFKK